ncbi:MAG: TonB-dependent receptor domain-containing protein [Flavisolibacter sp.]
MIKLAMLMGIFHLCNANAQNTGMVSGHVINEAGKSITGATVALLKASDSSTLKFTVTNKEGLFSFENVAYGKYLLTVTSVGHRKSFSNVFDVSPSNPIIRLADLRLTLNPKSLTGVTVTAQRPLIENTIDRTVVNVDASVMNIGTSALEVLEKSPGVSVDREGNISLKGKEGVLVMVDGRPTRLGGADLANLLRNMTANQLDQIEIMTNPPARYDAEGNSGIINIKTKKLVNKGYNGSATIGYTQGRYPKTNEGFNFNYREGKVNVFTNLSHNYRKGFGTLLFNRNILNANNSTIENIFDQHTDKILEGNAYTAKMGVDFFTTKKTTLGIAVDGITRPTRANNLNVTKVLSASNDPEKITKASVDNSNKWKSFGANLYTRHLLDAKGQEMTSDFDFLNYRSANEQFMVNSFYDAAGNETASADTLTGDLPQDIKVYSGRVDYLHPLKKGAKFEVGIKASWVNTDNNASYDSIQNGSIVHDFNRSNHFIYEENVNAAYVNLSTPLSKKLSAQFGLRLENTNANGRQITTGVAFDRHYTQLFPTAYFQYKANDKNSFGANFGRRVRRPNYQSLNPFIRFIDRYTYSQGNPNLKPSITNNFELSHTWKLQITTTINYTSTKDIIDAVIEQKGQEAYSTPANISSLDQLGISVSANTPVTKWWRSNININVFNNNYKGVVSQAPIDMAATSLIFTCTQQFRISKTFTGEINGRYRNGWLEGVMRARPVWFVGAGVSKQVLKNRGTLRLAVRDIFHTQKFRGKSRYGNVDFDYREINESRVVSIGFSYSFSKGKKLAPLKRTEGSANEEQERIEE